MDKTIKKIGKKECKILRDELAVALGAVLEDFGLSAKIGNMTFTGDTVSFKTTVAVDGYDGDREEFRANCYKYGLSATHFGAEFTSQGETYELVGIKPRSRKFPFVGKSKSSGKKYKFGKFVATRLLEAAA